MVGAETAHQKAETGMQTISLAVILYHLEQVRLGSGPSPVVLQLSSHGVFQPNTFIKLLQQDFSDDSLSRASLPWYFFYRFYLTIGTFGFDNFRLLFSSCIWYVFAEHLLCPWCCVRYSTKESSLGPCLWRTSIPVAFG